MKFELPVEYLKKNIGYLSSSVASNPSLPSLACILCEAKDGIITFASTNLSLGIKISFNHKTDKNDTFLINASLFSGLINSIPDNNNVSIEKKENIIQIKTKTSTFKIKTITTEDFPTIPYVLGDSFEIHSNLLVDGIKSVYYSALASDIKPELSSVMINSDGDDLVFVSTDSFRLAEKKIKIENIISVKNILLPIKNATELMKILSGEKDKSVVIVYNKNQISFSFDGVYITSRLYDGIYPDYKQIIPKSSKTVAYFLKEDIISSVKISSIFSDKFFKTKMSIDSGNQKICLSSINQDIGEQETIIESKVEGESVDVYFHNKNLVDCFQSLKDEYIEVKIESELKPIIIKTKSNDSFLYLLMPMNK